MYNPKLQFHFTGIGGSGMSGIAAILLDLGFIVSGSDIKESAVVERLRSMGAQIAIGHAAGNVPASASLLVYSSAVEESNPEMQEAKSRGIPVIRRAEVLAELMRLKFGVAVAGSHGKTTTTSMTGSILEMAGLDPTVIIGGVVKSFGGGGKLGKSNYLVAESDESDRSFLLLRPTIAVVTNIDAEHMNSYSSLEDLEESFAQFVNAVPFYGLAVLCIDNKKVRALAEKYHGRKRTYGISPDAEIQAINIIHDRNCTSYELVIDGSIAGTVHLPMPGRHIAVNSLAAIAVALEFGVPVHTIIESLRHFSGVGRRLEVVSESSNITIIDDYGHHPTEIRASIRAVRDGWIKNGTGKLHVVFQPHRYSRTRDCFVEFLDAFEGADTVVLGDIYAAGEAPIEGVSAERLCEAMNHSAVSYVKLLDDCIDGLVKQAQPGDAILCLGAGSIGNLARRVSSAVHAMKTLPERTGDYAQ